MFNKTLLLLGQTNLKVFAWMLSSKQALAAPIQRAAVATVAQRAAASTTGTFKYLRYSNILALVLFVALFAALCTKAQASNHGPLSTKANAGANTGEITPLTPSQFFELITPKEGEKDFILLDVRTKEEFDEGHIKGAVNIDASSPDFESKVDKLNKNKTYFIYCRTGKRSASAARRMNVLGFKFIYTLEKGLREWEKVGLPVEK